MYKVECNEWFFSASEPKLDGEEEATGLFNLLHGRPHSDCAQRMHPPLAGWSKVETQASGMLQVGCSITYSSLCARRDDWREEGVFAVLD